MMRRLQYLHGMIGVNNVSYLYKILEAYWAYVVGNQFIDIIGGRHLTLSSSIGTDYLPATFSGTLSAPVDATLITADTNNFFYAGGIPRIITASDLVIQDLDRIPVDYDGEIPYNVNKIALLKPSIVLDDGSAQAQEYLNWLHKEFHLWITWSGGYNGYGYYKQNRTLP